jgi:hypothetical protein
MSKTTVVGSAPIAFTTAGGTALSIPLSTLSFVDSKIQIDIQPAGISASDKSDLESWLNYLVKIETLKRGEKTPPKPAIAIVAKNSGKAGNNIKIEFKDIQKTVDPVNSTFTATITATEIYDLSFDKTSDIFIEKVLGANTLVNVKGTATELPPKETEFPYKIKDGSPAKKSVQDVEAAEAPGSTAFTIEAKNKGKDGDDITVEISNVNIDAKTYTLTATWNPTFTDIKLGDLPAKLQGSQDVIIAEKPGSSEFAIPDGGVVVLNGGSDKQDAVTAKATVFFS